MILHFKCRDTQRLFEQKSVARFAGIEKVALRKLAQLHAAHSLSFLSHPPGNRLHALQGDRNGQYSLRVNDRWRICFVWNAGEVTEVEIVDYH